MAEANARLRDQLIALQKETKEKDITSKEMNEAMNQTYATANQEIQNLQTGEYFKAKESVHRVYGKHCSLTFLFLFPLSNLLHCHRHIYPLF